MAICKRDFALLADGGWKQWLGVPWPKYVGFQPMAWETTDYYRKYILVCPVCASIWCKSAIYDAPVSGDDWKPPRELSKWDIRHRHCERHLEEHVAEELHWRGEFGSWQPTHCPGSVVSIARSEHSDHPPTDLWESILHGLPSDLKVRELRLWAVLDLRLNPIALPSPTLEPAFHVQPPSLVGQPIAQPTNPFDRPDGTGST